MRDYEIKRIDSELEFISKSYRLKDKCIYLFGAGDCSRHVTYFLKTKGLTVEAIIDNDVSKQGGFCGGIPIVSLDYVLELGENNRKIFIICSDFWFEIVNQLENKKIHEESILVIKKKKETFSEKVKSAFRGRKVYNSLKKKYGNTKLFLCPYTGTGDIYLIGTFWKQYIDYYQIREYVFLVLSKACYRVTKLFDISNVVQLDNMRDAEDLISYYLFNQTNINMVILNDGWRELPYSRTEWLRGYKGLYFTQLFRKFVFGLPDDIKPQHPEICEITDDIRKLYKNNGLMPGRTVVLSPYSNTLLDLPDLFWERLVDELKGKGFTVCTNCDGQKEKPIAGTVGVFVKLDQAPQFVNYAGYFVGIRSGFCDIISGTSAKKIILYYRKNRFYNSSAYEYFNLKNMELCDDALEIEFSKEEINSILNDILEWL